MCVYACGPMGHGGCRGWLDCQNAPPPLLPATTFPQMSKFTHWLTHGSGQSMTFSMWGNVAAWERWGGAPTVFI